MEKQVSTLYPLDGSMDKRKTLEITRVMKGALSVSKSRTGEAIFRSNEFHKKLLERRVSQFEFAKKTEISSYDSKKRTITQRFSTVFGRHKATNDTINAYDEVITKALENTEERQIPLPIKPTIRVSDVESETEEGETCETTKEAEKTEDVVDGRQNIKFPPVNDLQEKLKGIRKSLDENERKPTVYVPSGILLPINRKFSRLKFHEEKKEEEPEVEVVEVKEVWPLENTEKYDKYIKTQKNRHEVLVTRNILKKIKKKITGKDTLVKFQMKSHLSDDPEEFVRNLTSAKTAPPKLIHIQNANKQFKSFISKLPSQNIIRKAPSYTSLHSARLFPPVKNGGSVKSTGRLRSLERSKTMPV